MGLIAKPPVFAKQWSNATPVARFRVRRAGDFRAGWGENTVVLPGGTVAPAATPVSGLEIVAEPGQG
jgi:hypothetical protein